MKTKFSKGDHVKVSLHNDNEYYNSFRDKELIITEVATNQEQHPGYDVSMNGQGLYDLKNAETGEDILCSLYDYELIKF